MAESKVVIVMGSGKDLDFTRKAIDLLEEFSIDYDLRVASAHKTPEKALDIIQGYEEEENIVEGGMLLKELFSNLIENSLKHSEGSMIEISCEKNDEEIRVIFKDDGKGVPDDMKDKITQKGYQGEDSSGSGLGMHLAKRIALTYGEGFKVKDSELGGARFDVILTAVEK